MNNLNSLTKDNILQIIAAQEKRIKKLENLLQGQPIAVVRIADASITSAKISSLSADKITTGTLSVYVGLGTDGKIKLEGNENRILIEDENADDRVLLGKGTY